MSDSRKRFEAWHFATLGRPAIWNEPLQCWAGRNTRLQFMAWQAAEAETARRCAELVEKHTRASSAITNDIKAEFPEAWK